MQTSVRQIKQREKVSCLRRRPARDTPWGQQQYQNCLFLNLQLSSLQALTSTTFRHTNKWKVTATLFLFIPFLTLGATGKRVGPKPQSLWLNTAILLDLTLATLPCLWLCTSWDYSLPPNMLNLPPLFTACFAWQSGFRVLSFFFHTYLRQCLHLSPTNSSALAKKLRREILTAIILSALLTTFNNEFWWLSG